MNENTKPQWTDHLKTLGKELEAKGKAMSATVEEDLHLKPKATEPKANA